VGLLKIWFRKEAKQLAIVVLRRGISFRAAFKFRIRSNNGTDYLIHIILHRLHSLAVVVVVVFVFIVVVAVAFY